MVLVHALIVGLALTGFILFLVAMFINPERPVFSTLFFGGAIALLLALGLCCELNKQSERTFEEKVGTEVYFLAPIYKVEDSSEASVDDDKYVIRSEFETKFACIIDDEVVQESVDNDYVGREFSNYFKPQVEVTKYQRTTERYVWHFKESESIEVFKTYRLLMPRDAVEYDYSFVDGKYVK